MKGQGDIGEHSRPSLEGTEHKVSLQVQDTNSPAGTGYKLVCRYRIQACLQVQNCRYRTQDKSVGS